MKLFVLSNLPSLTKYLYSHINDDVITFNSSRDIKSVFSCYSKICWNSAFLFLFIYLKFIHEPTVSTKKNKEKPNFALKLSTYKQDRLSRCYEKQESKEVRSQVHKALRRNEVSISNSILKDLYSRSGRLGCYKHFWRKYEGNIRLWFHSETNVLPPAPVKPTQLL